MPSTEKRQPTHPRRTVPGCETVCSQPGRVMLLLSKPLRLKDKFRRRLFWVIFGEPCVSLRNPAKPYRRGCVLRNRLKLGFVGTQRNSA